MSFRRAAVVAALALAACKTIPLTDDPNAPSRDARISPPKLFDVEWWKPLVAPTLLEYQPAETARPAVDPDTERIFVSTRDGRLRCISPVDGSVEWELKTGGHAFAGVTVRDGIVYVPGGDGVLYALRSLTGEKLWSYNVGEELVTTPTIAEGKILIGSQTDTVFAVDQQTGKWVWQYRRDAPSGFTVRGTTQPIVNDDLVYMGFADGTFVALGLSDGVSRWERKLTVSGGTQFLDVDSTPVVDEDGRVYVASYKDGLYALKGQTGDLLWFTPQPGVDSLVLRGSVLFSTGDGAITAHETNKGRRLWSVNLSEKTSKGKGTNAGRAPTFVRGYLVVPTATGLAFVEPSKGHVRIAWNPGKGITATPAPFSSTRLGNRMYVLSNGGALYALQMVGTGG